MQSVGSCFFRMLGIVDTFMSSVTLDTGDSLHLVLNNMELKVEDIDTEETKQGITYTGDSETGNMVREDLLLSLLSCHLLILLYLFDNIIRR